MVDCGRFNLSFCVTRAPALLMMLELIICVLLTVYVLSMVIRDQSFTQAFTWYAGLVCLGWCLSPFVLAMLVSLISWCYRVF